KLLFWTALRRSMSAGHRETPPCQGGTRLSTLMSFSNVHPLHMFQFFLHVLCVCVCCSQGTCVNLNTLDQVSPLHGACSQGHVACAKLLVESGANVNGSTVDGQTPLSEACACGHVTCVSLLLQHGATPLGTSQTSSPIHRAAAKGHSECIQPLVQHGADVDQFIAQSGFPLHVACSHQHLSSVRKLLQLGATVNSRVSGASPLHIAAGLSDPEMVSVLLDHGADRCLRNSEGKQPVDVAPPNSLAESPMPRAVANNPNIFLSWLLLLDPDGCPGASPLMQLCRLYIRNTVGKQRLGGIHDLHLPTQVKQYLLYQSDPGGDLVPFSARF
uniref:SOCS box domain-containing protein n=1 Tax=Cyclopterus lumpus TaxID=8103 RepID=A0A8C2ZS81_CYCLU